MSGCTGVPHEAPGESDEEEDPQIWIWSGPGSPSSDPLDPVRDPALHEKTERNPRTTPLFEKLEEITDPPPT
jgi:hypothetical protein